MQWEILNRTVRKETHSQKGGKGTSPEWGIKHTPVGPLSFIQFALVSLVITLFLFSLKPKNKDWACPSKTKSQILIGGSSNNTVIMIMIMTCFWTPRNLISSPSLRLLIVNS